MLSKGSFVCYYGGSKLFNNVSDSGSPVCPIMLALSLIFQLSLYTYKNVEMRKSVKGINLIALSIWTRLCVDKFVQHLRSTVFSGFNNVYSLSFLGESKIVKLYSSLTLETILSNIFCSFDNNWSGYLGNAPSIFWKSTKTYKYCKRLWQ